MKHVWKNLEHWMKPFITLKYIENLNTKTTNYALKKLLQQILQKLQDNETFNVLTRKQQITKYQIEENVILSLEQNFIKKSESYDKKFKIR